MKAAVLKYVQDSCEDPANVFARVFFDEHIRLVAGYARQLAGITHADAEVVELAAYHPDIAAVRDFRTVANHAEKGANEARLFLAGNGYDT